MTIGIKQASTNSIAANSMKSGSLTKFNQIKNDGESIDANKSSSSTIVSLSEDGLKKSAKAKGQNENIEKSNLPDQTKEALIRIRELKKELAEKMKELQEAMNDTSLSPDSKRIKIASLQGSVNALSSALNTANSEMQKASKNLSESDAKTVSMLASK